MAQARSVSILAPTLSDGGVIRAYFLAEMIKSLGLDVEITGPLRSDSRIYPMPPDGISVVPIPCTRIWQYTSSLLKHLSGDIIYAVKPKTSSFGSGLFARRKLSRPLILDIDDWERSYRVGRKLEQGKLLFMEQLIRFADAVTVNNTALQQRFGGMLLPSGKNEALYDPAHYNPDECRRRLGLEGRFVLMFPGTVVAHSGLEDLLMAMYKVGRDDLVLVVVGGRRSGVAYMKRQLSRWANKIEYLPEVNSSVLPSVIAAAHVVTAPHRNMITSRYNFPIKLIDGLAMGKPILATRVGDIPSALDGVAYLAEPDNPDDLASVLMTILTDPEERARRSRLSRALFDKCYSLKVLGKEFSRVIESL